MESTTKYEDYLLIHETVTWCLRNMIQLEILGNTSTAFFKVKLLEMCVISRF